MDKQILKYFLYNQLGGKYKWSTLSHNGPLFPPEYVAHGIPIIFNNKEIVLNKEAEECATMYAKYIETEYVKNKTFKRNFWHDWKKLIPSEITSLDECDFSKIYNYLLKQKESVSIEEKKSKALNRKEQEKKYTIAIVDNVEQPVGNFHIEPPSIFQGRGCHPKLGRIKKRIYPEDIILNIGKEATIPESLPGHHWQKVINDRKVEWLASWKDTITSKTKYIWLASHSDMKGSNDQKKYDTARILKRKIKMIRKINEENLNKNDIKIRQTATALYFIDQFALRVGNEKSEDEADTVGVTSLRVEHLTLEQNNIISLDFLGKDSVRYKNKVAVIPIVYENIKLFLENKTDDDQIFDKINPNDINTYLHSFMKGLTSKVFRTYNASNLFQKELEKVTYKIIKNKEKGDNVSILLDLYNRANAKVALLCNHQKNISKSFQTQLNKINQAVKLIKQKLKEKKSVNLKKRLQKLKAKKKLKLELKNLSLGTSKTNYIDPRITVAFLKKHNIPIEKIFSKTLQDKFKWAFQVDQDWYF